jgi:hypothetical protein
MSATLQCTTFVTSRQLTAAGSLKIGIDLQAGITPVTGTSKKARFSK